MGTTIHNYTLTVDGEKWSFVDHLGASTSEEKVYTVEVGDNGKSTIRFGDGIQGKRPNTGAKIVVEYRFGGGPEGNVV